MLDASVTLRVHHVQHVRARVLVHRLQVGVGGVPHGLGRCGSRRTSGCCAAVNGR